MSLHLVIYYVIYYVMIKCEPSLDIS